MLILKFSEYNRIKFFNYEKVHAVINNKFKLKFDWFPLEEDITVANLCFNQAINLVIL